MGYRVHEACELTFTREEVLRELRRHNADIAEFFRDKGDRPEYTGREVLYWLGY